MFELPEPVTQPISSEIQREDQSPITYRVLQKSAKDNYQM